MSCYDTLKLSLPECPDQIQVNAHLTPEVQYTWTVTDRRFGTLYIGTAETDENGAFTFNTSVGSAFPPGLFNRYAGVFELSVKLNATQCGNSPMTICSPENESAI